MKFKIGDKISFLNEKGKGEVIDILDGYRLLVKNEDGFEISYSADQLVPLSDESAYKLEEKMKSKWISEKDEIVNISHKKKSTSETLEIDLHIHVLLDNYSHLTDYEKLTYQIKYFQKCLDSAIASGIKKIIFIHGVGKGTLKEEMLYILRTYNHIQFYEAPYKQYGFGAIAVET
ncbi:MAG: Smr/MutS family protein [Bacteroidota bacterium]